MDRIYEPGSKVEGTVYRVIREIGRGGMGRVYEVEDETVGKRYALKVLIEAQARRHPEVIERMKLESRTIVRIAHPNIVDVITAGVTRDDNVYYVMALLNGSPLRKIIKKKKRIDALEVVRVGIDIADALERAHRAGVVHRDVKPDNIFIVVRQDMTTHGMVVDFGVAGLLDDLRSQEREQGKMLGTPRYAAPEQQRGEKANPRMDVWGLGMSLFEAIVGHLPFKARTLAELIKAVQGPDCASRISDFLPEVMPQLDDLMARMLEKNPASRVADMAQVARELKEIQRLMEAEEEPPLGDDGRTQETLLGAAAPTVPGDPSGAAHSGSSDAPSARTTPHVDVNMPELALAGPAATTAPVPVGAAWDFAPHAAASVAKTPSEARTEVPPPADSVDRFVDMDREADAKASAGERAFPRVRPGAGEPAEGRREARVAKIPVRMPPAAGRIDDSAGASVRSLSVRWRRNWPLRRGSMVVAVGLTSALSVYLLLHARAVASPASASAVDAVPSVRAMVTSAPEPPPSELHPSAFASESASAPMRTAVPQAIRPLTSTRPPPRPRRVEPAPSADPLDNLARLLAR